ncbi:ferredoxin--NADP reductase, root isozyme, chloroplastic-like [Dioscorea cayenensis subsp. rotundata]|uniref:ferredoxin--NADP(+) reductase n=1 Tax=Dioscorea cayennensis subsp. rotundata TaxID=55577 RepID=A0AB40CHP6_DIOCR|nr:ferredoxin--NADP reductase, root isozyme, chloroplastic-like [Dioscorea cayenensis subsp. rotundata]
MALKADLCSVMDAKMRPGKGLGFVHPGSRIFNNLSLRNNASTSLPCLSLKNQKQHSNYNRMVLCMSARGATRLSAAAIPLEAEDTRPLRSDPGPTYTTTVVSNDTLVGPKGGLGETCHIVLDHGGSFTFVEGQYLGVILPSTKKMNYFSVASSDHDKTISLCVRRSQTTPDSISDYLCRSKAGDTISITGPYGGQMVFPNDPNAKHIMVTTTTGIAPCRSNLEGLFPISKSNAKFTGLAWLIAGAENYNSLLYNEEFLVILKDYPGQFRYQRALNNSVADSIYRSGDEIFTLLDGGAYIYFAGSMMMMPEIYATCEQIATERFVVWADMLARLRENDQWRVEVY